MVKNSEYAAFSLDSYQKAEDNVQMPPNWQIFRTSNDYGLSTNGYFGIAYLHVPTNRLVITHRGTDSLFTDLGDDIALALGHATEQYTDNAIPFTDQVKTLFAQQFPTLAPAQYITHTGHSLGAFLAELCSTRDQVKAVTFDSPGSRPNIQKLINDGEFPSNALTTADQNTITFNAAPNI